MQPARILHRPLKFDFSQVPRYWLGDSPFATHFANAVNLLFPAGERFFIRSVRHFEESIDDPELRAQVRAFYAQEGSHSGAHDAQLRALEAQGYDVKRILDRYDHLAWDLLAPRFSPQMHLAITVALEHYTAIMAENAFHDHLIDHAHPVMRELLLWHAAEEIEHKAVAFDVLAAVNPSYALRMGGMALATIALFGFWAMSFAMLAAQEKAMTGHPMAPPPPAMRESVFRRVVLRGLREYARRDFHPNDHDTLPLAHRYLAGAGLLDGTRREVVAQS